MPTLPPGESSTSGNLALTKFVDNFQHWGAAMNANLDTVDAAVTAVQAAVAAPVVPGAPDTSIQTNQGGVFTGDANLTWDNTQKTLTVGPAESALDPNIQGYWSPSSVLVTGTVDDITALAIEAQAPNYVGGLGIVAEVTGSGSGEAVGLADDVRSSGTGDHIRLLAAEMQVIHGGSGTADATIALQVRNTLNSGGGVITDNVGVDILAQSVGTNNWALRTNVGKVEFGDVVTAPVLNIGPALDSALSEFFYTTPSNVHVTGIAAIGNGSIVGVEFQSDEATANVTGIYVNGVMQATAANNTVGMNGIEADVYTDPNSTHDFTSNLVAGAFYAEHDAPGTLAQAIGVQIWGVAKGGSSPGPITTSTGLQIADVTSGVTNYAIQTGLGQVSFGGTVTAPVLNVGVAEATLNPELIGYTVPSTMLITGSATAGAAGPVGVEFQSDETASPTGLYVVGVQRAIAADSQAGFCGIESDVYTDAASTHNFNGTVNSPLTAAGFFIEHDGSGTLAQGVGVRIWSAAKGGAGLITENIGLQIDDQTAAVTNYAIKTGLGQVSFGDAVTAPTLTLGATAIDGAQILSLGPAESTLVAKLQDYTGPTSVLITADVNTYGDLETTGWSVFGIEFQANENGWVAGNYTTGVSQAIAADNTGGMVGIESDVFTDVNSTFNFSSIQAFSSYVEHDAPGTLNQAMGVYIGGIGKGAGAGDITEAIGLYIGDQTTGVTNYAIRAGQGKVQFASLATGVPASVIVDAAGTLSTTSPGASDVYVQSRAQNLITNGSGLMQSNYNFSGFTFDPVETFSGGGSFKINVAQNARLSDEYIPVDPTQTYVLAGWGKSGDVGGGNYTAANSQYLGIVPCDIDGQIITPDFYSKVPGAADTTLAATLHVGDTTMTLTDATGWAGYRNMTWYPYTNSKGYSYPNYTYSRNETNPGNTLGYVYENGLWAPGGVTGNVITLTAPWPGPELAAGTPVRNNNAGGTYKYIALGGDAIPNAWTRYSGLIGGIDTGGVQDQHQFPYGTAYIRLLFLINYQGAANNNVRWNNLTFGLDTSRFASGIQVLGVPVYANNAAAVAGGLAVGGFYRTGANPDQVCVVH